MDWFSWLADPKAWIGLVTLTFLQIVLGVDNIVLLTILSGQLREEEQARARKLGLIVAAISRILLLILILWVSQLVDKPFLRIGGIGISGKDLILIAGGLFLIAKATMEIHSKMEGDEGDFDIHAAPSLGVVLAQIFVLDIVFSLDSVITAVGMIKIAAVQVLAVVLAVIMMLMFIEILAKFVNKHPTIKILALSFLVLIGVNLVAEGLSFPIPSGYTYFAMAWSVGVEMLNLRFRKKARLRSLANERLPDPISAPAPAAPAHREEQK